MIDHFCYTSVFPPLSGCDTDIETTIEEIRTRQQSDQENLQDAIYKLKINQE